MLDKEKAFQFLIEQERFEPEYVEEEATFYGDNFDEAFEWLYIDEADSRTDLLDIVLSAADIETNTLVELGRKSVKEYMVLNNENFHDTPYGLVHLHV